ncbi:MAG: hypothetical protein ETSY2_02820 [Candidatus Entotheonella gemina]|uniref:VOC domain-containing protein n=1 Tax=Candidatus Entotheonella gemina TaxID=1429439 RepID=W4MF88_9BACT|nr:MAG: hypothetical protein ETSY2_02820 [Candidatus Entotheonella gemina]
MIQVKMVHHINVQITDRQRTREWYEKVLGATFLDRGEALNQRMLQLNIGSAEMHFSETDTPMIPKQPHFALEVANWETTLAHLDALGVEYSRTGQAFSRVGTGESERWAKREDNGEHYTYIHDPDGNLIELVHHPWAWWMPMARPWRSRTHRRDCVGGNCRKSRRNWGNRLRRSKAVRVSASVGIMVASAWGIDA